MMTPEQCRAARGWLEWSQDELAARASVSLSTIRNFEKGRNAPIKNNLEAMQRAFEAAGVHLTFLGTTATGITTDDARSRIGQKSNVT